MHQKVWSVEWNVCDWFLKHEENVSQVSPKNCFGSVQSMFFGKNFFHPLSVSLSEGFVNEKTYPVTLYRPLPMIAHINDEIYKYFQVQVQLCTFRIIERKLLMHKK